MIWGYYVSPMMYRQNGIAMNEFLDERWNIPIVGTNLTIGRTLLKARGMFVDEYWYWICVAALLGLSFLFNIFFIVALTFMNPISETKSVILEEVFDNTKKPPLEGIDMAVSNTTGSSNFGTARDVNQRGMVLPTSLYFRLQMILF